MNDKYKYWVANLYVRLWESDHLWKDINHLQVLKLVPLPCALSNITNHPYYTNNPINSTGMLGMESGASGTHMMQNMNPVGPFGGFSIMNYIGHQVVGGDLLCGLRLFC